MEYGVCEKSMTVTTASEVDMRIMRLDNVIELGDADFVFDSFELEIVR